MKSQIRLLGIDDSPFTKGSKEENTLVGVLFRGSDFLDGIMTTRVHIDGEDATERIVQMIERSKFKTQIRAILLKGIAVAGLNVINIRELQQKTKIPVIVVMRKRPVPKRMLNTLEKIGMRKKARMLEGFPPVERMRAQYVQYVGLSREECAEVLRIATRNAAIPEALRVAHMIAAGFGLGESHGDA